MAQHNETDILQAGDMFETLARMEHPLAKLLALKIALEAPESLPTANVELAQLADYMNQTLPPGAVAKYWQSPDGKIQRVYVSRNRKKAGYVVIENGKARYEEIASDDLIRAFKIARRQQKQEAK